MYIYIYIYTHTYTYIHTYICMYARAEPIFVEVDQGDHPRQADGHQQYAQGDWNQAPDDDEAHPEKTGQSVAVGQILVVDHDYAGQAAVPQRKERDEQHPDVDGRSPVDRSRQKEDLRGIWIIWLPSPQRSDRVEEGQQVVAHARQFEEKHIRNHRVAS